MIKPLVKLLRDINIYGKKYPAGSIFRMEERAEPFMLVVIDGQTHKLRIGKDAEVIKRG